jgi:hypothetical protein
MSPVLADVASAERAEGLAVEPEDEEPEDEEPEDDEPPAPAPAPAEWEPPPQPATATTPAIAVSEAVDLSMAASLPERPEQFLNGSPPSA